MSEARRLQSSLRDSAKLSTLPQWCREEMERAADALAEADRLQSAHDAEARWREVAREEGARADLFESRLREAERDARRYRWLRDRLDSADFAYGDPPRCVLAFAIPTDMQVSANLDKTLDRAMEGEDG